MGRNKFDYLIEIDYQASTRGGILKINLSNDRVIVAGQAVTMIKSKFTQNLCGHPT